MALSTSDLVTLAETDVFTALTPDQFLPILSSPPFVNIPGTFNARDLALVPGVNPGQVRPGLLIRSGGFFAGLPPQGVEALKALGVKRIFDLRSVREHEKNPDPEVEGIETVWVRPGEEDAMVQIQDFVEGEGELGYELMYLDVLKVYKGSLKAVLEHVRDRPREPALFHCTAGRDRTGVVAGLLLSLAGASDEAVELDFILSRIGTEPARQQLLAFALQGAKLANPDAPGFQNLCNLKVRSWRTFKKAVERDFGGFEGYVTGTLEFSKEDLEIIKANLAGKK